MFIIPQLSTISQVSQTQQWLESTTCFRRLYRESCCVFGSTSGWVVAWWILLMHIYGLIILPFLYKQGYFVHAAHTHTHTHTPSPSHRILVWPWQCSWTGPLLWTHALPRNREGTLYILVTYNQLTVVLPKLYLNCSKVIYSLCMGWVFYKILNHREVYSLGKSMLSALHSRVNDGINSIAEGENDSIMHS